MARLNEAPLRSDPIDPEKRKFVRNNNDLVRVNYTQQKRIRELEIEQSRLRTDNLCLREEILQLQHQLSDLADNVQLSEIEVLQEQLQRKLEDFGEAVAGLGKFKKPGRETRQPEPSRWRRETPVLELAGRAPRMPAIQEDKHYPRRTLGAAETHAIRLSDQSNDSPDLGPPPVAHFDADPIKFDQPEAILEQEHKEECVDSLPADFAVNLESRRKRRETQLVRPQTEDETAAEQVVSTSPVKTAAPKTGAKRKLDMRETEERQGTAETFDFTRRSMNVQELQTPKLEPISSPVKQDPNVAPAIKAERRVLGEKSVNLSPRKVAVAKKGPIKAALLSDGSDRAEPRARARRPRVSNVLAIPNPDVAIHRVPSPVVAAPDVAMLPPKTPAADLLSPTSEPSSLSQASASSNRDPSTLANLEGMTRPSRRARAVTNYAEPSLNTKMRRPAASLVDAVYIKTANDASERRSRGLVSVKRERAEDEDSAWKNLASVPAAPQEQPTETAYQRSPLTGKVADSAIPKPTSPTLSSRATLGHERQDSLSKRLQELDLYDFKEASPPQRRVSALELRKSRRHSSIVAADEAAEALSSSPRAKSNLEASPDILKDNGVVGDRPVLPRSASQPIGRSERLASRRRSMLV